MDFLNAVKQKLLELEEQARLMEQGAQASASQKSRPLAGLKAPEGKAKASRGGRGRAQETKRPHLVSDENFETPACVTGERGANPGPSGRALPMGTRPRLIDDLHGRLDEAFLLSEILGPPRCMRDWSD